MHSPLRMSARLMLLGAAFGSLVCLAGEAAPAGEKPLVRDGALVQQPGGGVHLNHVQVDGLEGCRNALLGAGLSGGVVFLPLLDASLKAQGSDLPSGFVPLAQPHAKEGEQGRESALIEAFCAYSGEQKAALLRELILSKAQEVLHGANYGMAAMNSGATNQQLLAA